MRVIELFSGIGGMHFALKGSGIQYTVVAAVDINTSANEVYKLNFPETPVFQRNIQSFSSEDINRLEPDMIMMSPPCQPFTRVGLKKDSKDSRSDGLMHIIKLLPDLTNKLKFIILENVKGFEVSCSRNLLVQTLRACNFDCQEFLLNPNDYYIPNSRLRYYLIAARGYNDDCLNGKDIVMNEIPFTTEELARIHCEKNPFVKCKKGEVNSDRFEVHSLTNILTTDSDTISYLVPETMLSKYAQLFDIVYPFYQRSCCFTKAYGRYAEGTGSVLCPTYSKELAEEQLQRIKEILKLNESENQRNAKLSTFMSSLGLRFFSPREIASLMCFPESFVWPTHYSSRQMYRLLGNSINVYIVTLLALHLSSKCNINCSEVNN